MKMSPSRWSCKQSLPTVFGEGRRRQQVLQNLAVLLKRTLHLLPGHELAHLFGQFPEFLKENNSLFLMKRKRHDVVWQWKLNQVRPQNKQTNGDIREAAWESCQLSFQRRDTVCVESVWPRPVEIFRFCSLWSVNGNTADLKSYFSIH